MIRQALILTINLGLPLNAPNAVGKVCGTTAILFRTHRNQNRPPPSGYLRYLVNERAKNEGPLLAALLRTHRLGSCTRPFHVPASAAKLSTTHEAVRNLASREDAVA